MIVGEAFGREEAQAQAPFVGTSGKLLWAMLNQAGIKMSDCYVTNVLNLQPTGKYPDNDLKNVTGPKAEGVPGLPAITSGKYLKAEFASELERL